MYNNIRFVSEAVAEKIKQVILEKFGGIPTENRVLILSPKDQEVKVGDIIIPGTNKEDRPNKGVVIIPGKITEENYTYKDHVKVGRVVTYGMYAGKKIEFDNKVFKDAGISFGEDRHEFSVLSLNEVIFTENNPM